MACMQPPARKDGGLETGNGMAETRRFLPVISAEIWMAETRNGKLKTERAFWEPTPERKLQHLGDLAKNKLWMDIIFYARDNPEVARSAIALLVKARREIVRFREMEREYCRDADRILRFVAEECPYPSIGKRAVADIVLMGSAGGEKVFKGEMLFGIAMGAKNPQVAMYALDQLKMLGAKHQLRWLAEDKESGADWRIKASAASRLAEMEASDLHASGHGC